MAPTSVNLGHLPNLQEIVRITHGAGSGLQPIRIQTYLFTFYGAYDNYRPICR